MSTVKTNAAQIGQSLTATNNFTMYQPASPDGTVRWGVGNAGSVTDIITLNSSGNVGIGTNSPSYKVHVVSASDYQGFFRNSASATGALIGGVSGGGILTSDSSGTPLFFGIGGTVRATLDTSGNFGIGTSSPALKLDVRSSSAGCQLMYFSKTGTYTSYAGKGSSDESLQYYLDAAAPQIWYTSGAERMRIDDSGNLLVGTTSTASGVTGIAIQGNNRVFAPYTTATASAGTCMHGRRDTTGNFIQFTYNGWESIVGTVSTNGSSVAYNTSSDYRLKENIQPMQNALDVVAQLNPVTYTWKADGSDGQGFIAHELQAVVPDCVTGEKDAVDAEGKPVYQGIDTSFLVATLTKAIQEQQDQINQLKAEVAALKGA